MPRAALLIGFALCAQLLAAKDYPDRFVWVFGWGLGKDQDVAEISQLFETAGKSGINGAVASLSFDSLCKQPPEYFRRLNQIKAECEKNGLELIPALFSVGYGGGVFAHDKNLAEGLPVVDASFEASGGKAVFVPSSSAILLNGGFEDHNGNRMKSFAFHDDPGVTSFADINVFRSGKASIRLENFTANPHGHGRVMQTIKLTPRRSYRVSLWVKTENLQPPGAFQATVLAGNRNLAPREFNIPSTTDWKQITMLFNSLDATNANIYAGLWGGKAGKAWLDDWTIEEVGPVNVLRRPGAPVTVRSEDGKTTYLEEQDYAPLVTPNLPLWRDNGETLALKLPANSRIHEGQKLKVSWFHPMIIHDSQVGACMGEPALYEIYEHEAKLLAEHLKPRRVLLNMDEVRTGGTCNACKGHDMAKLLGECVTKQAEAIRKYSPGAQVYVWSDMLDPNHNARGEYYLVQGDYTGSWNHVPKDLIIAVWGGEPREKSLRFFKEQGFQMLAACYYDADDLADVKGWIKLADQIGNVRGFMYTPWQKKYSLLPAFGELLK